MEDTSAPVTTFNICRGCSGLLERRVGNTKFRFASEPDTVYPGTVTTTVYFKCGDCSKAYMSPKQFDSDFLQEVALTGEFVFVLAPLTAPPVTIEVVDWLKE